jgi:hypothetical protein
MFETTGEPGSTVTIEIYLLDSLVGSPITLTESTTLPGYFTGSYPTLDENTYRVRVLDDGVSRGYLYTLNWDGTKEITLPVIYDQLAQVISSLSTSNGLTKEQIALEVESELNSILTNILTAAELSALPLKAEEINVDNDAVVSYVVDGVTVLKQRTTGVSDEPVIGPVRKQVIVP